MLSLKDGILYCLRLNAHHLVAGQRGTLTRVFIDFYFLFVVLCEIFLVFIFANVFFPESGAGGDETADDNILF